MLFMEVHKVRTVESTEHSYHRNPMHHMSRDVLVGRIRTVAWAAAACQPGGIDCYI